jgi:sugar lactone lactonase YvrE
MRVTDIAYDSAGNLWVLDTFGQMLHKFDQNNQLLFTIGQQPEDSDPGRFDNPGGFAIDQEDRVWVVDQWNKRIQIFDSDGNLLAVWDGCMTTAGCFMNTGFVLVGGNDIVYVSDYDENGLKPARLLKFHITSMPEVPIMVAATPAAAPMATPDATPAAG